MTVMRVVVRRSKLEFRLGLHGRIEKLIYLRGSDLS